MSETTEGVELAVDGPCRHGGPAGRRYRKVAGGPWICELCDQPAPDMTPAEAAEIAEVGFSGSKMEWQPRVRALRVLIAHGREAQS